MSARCALIEAEKASYPIAFMCALLGVARSSFYAWRARTESPSAARRRELTELIKRAFADARQVHGCRRITRDLNRAGHECSVGFVAEVMRGLGLRAVQPRAYKRTAATPHSQAYRQQAAFPTSRVRTTSSVRWEVRPWTRTG